MQENLSEGIIGRVLVDRNTAFHFLDKSGLKRKRQIRLIRNIDYPLDYYLAHVSKGILPTPSMSPNDTELAERKAQLADCGPMLKELSVDLVAVSKSTAEEQLIPAELQVNIYYKVFKKYHIGPAISVISYIKRNFSVTLHYYCLLRHASKLLTSSVIYYS